MAVGTAVSTLVEKVTGPAYWVKSSCHGVRTPDRSLNVIRGLNCEMFASRFTDKL
jgi:hypothetical protein